MHNKLLDNDNPNVRKVLLAVLAHPDDESYGIGGTLAKYSSDGFDVHVAIATDGSQGTPDYPLGNKRIEKIRFEETKKAAKELGVKLHFLNFKDSGMGGSDSNGNNDVFINQNEKEVVSKILDLFESVRPLIVITHDKTGGYFHPDHIFCSRVTTSAFELAQKKMKHPPKYLYYSVIPKKLVKVFSFFLKIKGGDPKKHGRNQDIDYTKIGVNNSEIDVKIDIRKYWDRKRRACKAHVSQGGDNSSSFKYPKIIQFLFMKKEYFFRFYP